MITINEWRKSKMPSPQDDLIDFCEKRRKGAEKIAREARAKGGFSILTAYHFEAKLPVYDEIIKKLKAGEVLNLNAKFREKMKELTIHLNQEKFQKIAGVLEVLGEVNIENKKFN